MTPTQSKVALGALANMAENQPLVRAAVKYWWLMIPAGFVMYLRVRKRTSSDMASMMEDFGLSFGPVLPLIMLSESLAARQHAAAPVVSAGVVKEAQFTVQPAAPLPISGTPQPFPTV